MAKLNFSKYLARKDEEKKNQKKIRKYCKKGETRRRTFAKSPIGLEEHKALSSIDEAYTWKEVYHKLQTSDNCEMKCA